MNDRVWFVINIQMLYYHVIHFCIISFCQEINDLFTVLLIVCFWHKWIVMPTNSFISKFSVELLIRKQYSRGDSMIFKISLAADPSRSGTGWSGMVPSCHINYQMFDEFMFVKIITKKLIFTSNFSSVFRHTRSRQNFDTWFHNLGPPFIETT